MNRKKKVKETLLKKHKKMNSKIHRSNKPRYISKAERAKMEAEAAAENQQVPEETATEEQSENSAESDE